MQQGDNIHMNEQDSALEEAGVGTAVLDSAPLRPESVRSDESCSSQPMMDPDRRADALLRLSKAAGQVQGISRMVSADRYCVDVLNQIAAAQKALDGVAKIITRNYLERCVTDAINNGDPVIYDELMKVLRQGR